MTLQAVAAAVPGVAARATGAGDLIEDGVNGYLVGPRDVAAYADAIARLVQDDAARRAAGAAGQAKAAHYQWDRVNHAVIDAYLDVLAARRG